jgi:hypothetical protein
LNQTITPNFKQTRIKQFNKFIKQTTTMKKNILLTCAAAFMLLASNGALAQNAKQVAPTKTPNAGMAKAGPVFKSPQEAARLKAESNIMHQKAVMFEKMTAEQKTAFLAKQGKTTAAAPATKSTSKVATVNVAQAPRPKPTAQVAPTKVRPLAAKPTANPNAKTMPAVTKPYSKSTKN